MKKRFGQRRVYAILIAAMICGGCVDETPVSPQGVLPATRLLVRNVRAVYNPEDTRVIVEWDSLSENVDFFRVYRTARTGSDGFPDLSTLYYSNESSQIAGGERRYVEPAGLENTVWYYAVRAVQVNGPDTLWGDMPDERGMTAVRVGTEVAFSINRGDLFTAIDLVELSIEDAGGYLSAVRFTDRIVTGLHRTATGQRVTIDPDSPPSNSDIEALVSGGWIDAQLSYVNLAPGVTAFTVPDFDGSDQSRNPLDRLDFSDPAVPRSARWRLRQGNGVKTVYAELTYKTGADGVTRIDTVSDEIAIQPYRLDFFIANKTGTYDRTAFSATYYKTHDGAGSVEGRHYYYLYKPCIEFSFSTFSDTTFTPEFSYWLVFRDSVSMMTAGWNFGVTDLRGAWLETRPVHTTIAGGIGYLQNERFVYRYDFDPGKPGNENLAYLVRRRATPQDNKAVPFSLRGSADLSLEGAPSDRAIPGSFWGEEPLVYKKADGAYLHPMSDTITENVFDELVKLLPQEAKSNGIKEFWLVTRFKGKFFGDTRTYVVGYKNDRLYFDNFPARFGVQPSSDGTIINNNSTITMPFELVLSRSPSLWDMGKTRISGLYLVVARKPASLVWDYNVTPLHLRPSDLKTYPHRLFPFEVRYPSDVLSNVAWPYIDPSQWESGEYLMGIATIDEFGIESFPFLLESGSKSAEGLSNPWRVYVQPNR
jgi:hypothetical protein